MRRQSREPEYFEVQFDEALERMFNEETGLAAADQLGQRRNYLRLMWDHRFMPGWWHESSRALSTSHMLFDDSPWWVPVPYLRLVFKALAYAENQFACTYLRLGSHEERLTGHLLTECFSALRTVSEEVEGMLSRVYGTQMEVELAYSDLSAGSVVGHDGTTTMKERVTGADFALLVTHHLPGQRDPVTIGTAFQAKKVKEDRSQIDLRQLAALGKYAGWSGSRYCFYDMDHRRRLAPFVVEPDDMWGLDPNPLHKQKVSEVTPDALAETQQSITVQPVELGRSTLSEYLVFGMVFNGEGRTYESPGQAYQDLVLGGDEGSPVARVLALTFRPHQPEGEGVSMLRYMAE